LGPPLPGPRPPTRQPNPEKKLIGKWPGCAGAKMGRGWWPKGKWPRAGRRNQPFPPKRRPKRPKANQSWGTVTRALLRGKRNRETNYRRRICPTTQLVLKWTQTKQQKLNVNLAPGAKDAPKIGGPAPEGGREKIPPGGFWETVMPEGSAKGGNGPGKPPGFWGMKGALL